MDSGNSGSLQSSSGGEEYDSRTTESISPFLNPSLSFGSMPNPNHPQSQPPPQPPLSHHQSHPPTLFDPQAHNLGPFSHSPPNPNPNANSLYNLDLVWSRGQRSEPNYTTDLGNLTGLSSSSSQSLLGVHGPSQGPFPSSSTMSLPSGDGNGGRAAAAARSDQSTVIKNSRKRTRASRRAPTTVLTTDTSNFRQMVQEFTGIPAPPFSASPYSRRLDLFTAGSALRSGHMETLGPLYPFRSSVQKVVQPTMNDAIVPTSYITSATNNNTITTSIAGTSNTFSSNSSNYQLPSDHLGLFSKQPQTLLNIQNQSPILTFQPLLQTPLKYPSQGNSAIPSLDQGNLGCFDVNNGHGSQNVSGYKLNCSASTSDFHTEKGLENVSSRNEGTVDPWICPSD